MLEINPYIFWLNIIIIRPICYINLITVENILRTQVATLVWMWSQSVYGPEIEVKL